MSAAPCIAQLAAVWRRTCGVTPARPASAAARTKAFLTVFTGRPSNSTKACFCDPQPRPSPQMREQPVRDTDRRLALFGLPVAEPFPIYPSLKVDISAPDRGRQRSCADRRRACSAIEADQDEARDMAAASPLGFLPLLDLAVAPGRPDQSGGLVACKPAHARRRPRRQRYFWRDLAIAFRDIVIDRSAQVFELAAGHRFRAAFFGIFPAFSARDVGKSLARPEVEQSVEPLGKLPRAPDL